MTDNARRTGPAVEAHYQLFGWLMQTVERFPRSHKFLLGDRIQSSVFRDSSLDKGSINLNVERGVVVLRGEVPDQATRERLVADVEAVDGVWTVRDLLHLPGEEPASVSVG